MQCPNQKLRTFILISAYQRTSIYIYYQNTHSFYAVLVHSHESYLLLTESVFLGIFDSRVHFVKSTTSGKITVMFSDMLPITFAKFCHQKYFTKYLLK